MQRTLIVLITIAIAAIFYWQFFVPAPSPSEKIGYTPENTSAK